VDELQRGRWKSTIVLLPAIIQGLQREVLQNSLQQIQPHPVGRDPLYWVKEPGLKKPRFLEDLTPRD